MANRILTRELLAKEIATVTRSASEEQPELATLVAADFAYSMGGDQLREAVLAEMRG